MKKKHLLNRAFWVCVGMSTLLWLSIKLPKEYNYATSFNANYINVPSNKVLQRGILQKIDLSVRGTGFDLLGYIFSNKKDINFNIDGINYIHPERGYLLPYNYTRVISNQLPPDIRGCTFQDGYPLGKFG